MQMAQGVQNPVDYRQNKRAGQEQVMRAYGVKGLVGGIDPKGGMGAAMGGGAPGGAAGSSYGHPNRHYAPSKR